MRVRSVIAVGLVAAMLSGCGQGEEKKAAKPATMGQYTVGLPIASGNVAVYPLTLASINRDVTKKLDEVVSLEEARRNNWVVIKESDTNNFQIDAVKVTNNGPKKILLMAGELLVGGHQDRVVGADTVIEPGQTVNVPVYCVEQGRSTGDTDVFTPASHSVPTSVKMAAISGRQDAVWSNVSAFNLGAGMRSAGVTTVNAGIKMEKVQKRFDTDYNKLWSAISKDEKIVGAAVAIDGRVQSIEIFGSHAVYKGGMPTILRGALAEGAASALDARSFPNPDKIAKEMEKSQDRLERQIRRAQAQGTQVLRSTRLTASTLPVQNGEPILVHSTYVFGGH